MNEQRIKTILKQADPLPDLVSLLGLSESRNDAAIRLKELNDSRAIKFLLAEAQKTDQNGTFLFAMTDMDCAGHEMTLLKIGLASSWESKNHIIDIFENISSIPQSNMKMLEASINLKQQLLKSEDVIDLTNIEFLNAITEIMQEIPSREKAQVIQFPGKKPKF